MNKDELIAYWVESSNRDFITMGHLFEKQDYHWALFMGHLVLLKAYYVQNIGNQPPFTHNLLRLAEKSGLILSENQKDFLAGCRKKKNRTLIALISLIKEPEITVYL